MILQTRKLGRSDLEVAVIAMGCSVGRLVVRNATARYFSHAAVTGISQVSAERASKPALSSLVSTRV